MKKSITAFIIYLLIQISVINVISFEDSKAVSFADIEFNKHVIDNSIQSIGSVHVNDIDGDNENDVIGAAYDEGIAWWKNNVNNQGEWLEYKLDDNVDSSSAICSVDIDNDGDYDIVGTDWIENELALWINNGENPPLWTKQLISNKFSGCQSIIAIDIDLDSDKDIIAVAAFSNRISCWINIGGSPVQFVENEIDNKNGFTSVYAADLDGDKDIDVLGASWDLNLFCWWENNGENPIDWKWWKIRDNCKGAHSIYAYDIDDDNDIDVIGAAYSANDVLLWENKGDNPVTWEEHIIDDNFFRATTVSSADFDLDGDGDIIANSQEAGKIYIWWNGGLNLDEWIEQRVTTTFRGAWPIYIYDLDKDNDYDIISGGHYNNQVAWWENTLYNVPLKPATPNGPSEGKVGKSYAYKTNSSDIDGDSLYYWFDWGDGTNSGWLGPFKSSAQCEEYHSWETEGNYSIKVKAKDIVSLESEWSDPLVVTMIKGKVFSLFDLMFYFFQRFDILMK